MVAREEVIASTSTIRRSFFALAALGAVLSVGGVASAHEAAPVGSAPVQENHDVPKQFAIVANPLSTIVGRHGIDVTWMPELHHALVVHPFFHHVRATCTVNGADCGTETFQRFGGEVGYR